MRVFPFVLLASLLALMGCSGVTSSSGSDPVADSQKLQGTWKLTGATYDGDSISEDVRWTFDGDQISVTVHGTEEKSHFRLGTGGPNTIWVKHHDNPLVGQRFFGGTLTGIYELSGDRLRVCYDLTGRQYPKRFEAWKGSRQVVYELAREGAR